jgi:RimJ/RimL family protein N-acetyltransferase
MTPPPAGIPDVGALEAELRTPRLRLRELVDTDVDALWPYVSDPTLQVHMTWTAHTERAQTAAMIARMRANKRAGTDLLWGIEHAGQLAGCIGLHDIKWTLNACRVDRGMLGYWLAPPLWSRGIMTEAAGAVVRFAFDVIGLHKLVVGHFEGNTASARVIEKLGFRLVGRAEEHVWKNGRWYAHLDYELLADDPVDIALTQPISRR